MADRNFRMLLLLLIGCCGASAIAQSSLDNFDAFYARFKVAATHQDRAALSKMMSPAFAFLRTENVSKDEVFAALASNGGQQWANLKSALAQNQKPQPYTFNSKLLSRVLNCTPDQIIYNCLIVFQQNKNHQWQWKGMVMPPR